MATFPRMVPASDSSLLVVLADEAGPGCSDEVLRLTRALLRQAWVRNLHPAFCTVLVDFDPLATSPDDASRRVASLLGDTPAGSIAESRTVAIPVCYDADLAPDLEQVASLHGLAPEAVVELHAGAEYRVDFIGFSPGFPYLSGLPLELATPRRATPRPRVPAGSVAIGGAQAGVYPIESPGGWQIIGRTPSRLFAADRSPMTLLEMGDRVRFERISGREFERLMP